MTAPVDQPGRARDETPEAEPAPAAPLAAATAPAQGRRRAPAAAALIALAILLSKLFGLVRSRVMARYLGTSDEADAFWSALRIPNLLQNLFGEGVLSASFIPVYARLRAHGDEAEARRVAGAVLGVLTAVVAALVALGVLATPLAVDTIAAGFEGPKRDLTVKLVRILFPGTGLLVLGAWCLGVLNSHGKFFLSYAAPIAWNLAIIGALVVGGTRGLPLGTLVESVAWWTVIGSALTFAVQLPTAIGLLRGLPFSFDLRSSHVREVVRSFGPVFVSRGAVQLSAYVDLNFASRLGSGVQALLAYGQTIYLLPVALFGMSISAAELPAMAGTIGTDSEVRAALTTRVTARLRMIAFLVIPSAVAFLALGDVVAGTLFQTGAFRRAESVRVWAILAGSAVGLLASTLARLYASTFYALKDTRTPLRFALARIALSIVLGWAFAFPLPAALGVPREWGVVGLTASAGVAGWVEFALLRRQIRARVGPAEVPGALLVRLWGAGAIAAALAWAVRLVLPPAHPVVVGALVLGTFALGYAAATLALRVPEAHTTLARVRARIPARRGAQR